MHFYLAFSADGPVLARSFGIGGLAYNEPRFELRLDDFAAADWARGAQPVRADRPDGFFAAEDCTREAACGVIAVRRLLDRPPFLRLLGLLITITSPQPSSGRQ